MRPWDQFLAYKPVNTHLEMGAYEHLWQQPKTTTKRLANFFEKNPGCLPSDLVDTNIAKDTAQAVMQHFLNNGIKRFGLRINGTPDYPARLRDASEPVELLYYLGTWELAEAPRRIAVVGTRKVSEDGAARTRKLVRSLVEHDFTIVSGLAEGVDTIAHQTAIDAGGRTIAVIGTPLSENYPKQNKALQEYIARHFLLISQVPVLRYQAQDSRFNRFFFPERNKTMSALSDATVIVEASQTSGTLTQARAALQQGRKLFILENNFQNPDITWPANFEQKGAIRVREINDILREFELDAVGHLA